MISNPEFRRNLWLEFSPHRLVAMPAVLVLFLALIYAASQEPGASVATACGWIAAALIGIWGARNAMDCVAEEVRSRTWDGQRMSAIGPWAMTWGKLLGSASFAWYGGLMALVVLLLAAPRGWTPPPLTLAALIVTGSLLVQAVACLGGLAVARKGYARRGGAGGWVLVLLLFMVGPGLMGFFSETARTVQWWNGQHGFLNFVLGSAAFFAACAVFGVYRSMAMELQVRTVPWAFAAFILLLAAYFAGFWVHRAPWAWDARNALLLWGLLTAATLTYMQLFAENTGVVVFRRVQVRLERREWRRALQEMPCWPVGLALAAVFALLGVFLTDPLPIPPGPLRDLAFAPLALFVLLLRDAAIFLVFAFARQPRRAEGAALFYLILLYGILPGLLHAAEFKEFAQFVLPPILTQPGKAALIGAVHAAIACGLVAWRWRAYGRVEQGG